MMMSRVMNLLAAVAAVAVAGAACSSTTSPSAASSSIKELEYRTETFSGTLNVNGRGSYVIGVVQAGPVELTLAAVQTPGGAALSTPVGVGVGIPTGTTCPITTTTVASPALSAQLTVPLNPGVYCIEVFDAGNLTSAVNFAVRIRHP